MKVTYSTGIVDNSTIFHLIANMYEMLGGRMAGQSLCGRMKGTITKVNERPASCYSCLQAAKEKRT